MNLIFVRLDCQRNGYIIYELIIINSPSFFLSVDRFMLTRIVVLVIYAIRVEMYDCAMVDSGLSWVPSMSFFAEFCSCLEGQMKRHVPGLICVIV